MEELLGWGKLMLFMFAALLLNVFHYLPIVVTMSSF